MRVSLRIRLDGMVLKPFSRPFLRLQQYRLGQVGSGIVTVFREMGLFCRCKAIPKVGFGVVLWNSLSIVVKYSKTVLRILIPLFGCFPIPLDGFDDVF